MQKILVTGGCGFIGTNFIRYMLDKYPDLAVVNLDKLTYAGNPLNLADVEKNLGGKRYFFVHGDIADPVLVPEVIREHKVSAIINFAAESHVDRSIAEPAPFITTNVNGVTTLLDAARDLKVARFVQISTDEVYGSLGPEGKFTEQTPLDPNSPYSASKAAADLLVNAYHRTYGINTVITRCSNNYGPYQFPEKLIPLIIARAKRDMELPVYGDGLNVRDWIYVTDHCRAVDLAYRKGRPGATYNFGGNAEMTNISVVKTLLGLMGKPESLVKFVKDRPGHDRRYAMDYSLAKRELDFEPKVDFASGLEKTLAWYRDNTHWVEQVQSGEYLKFMQKWYGERL